MTRLMTAPDEKKLAMMMRAALEGDSGQYRDFLAAIIPVIKKVVTAKTGSISHDGLDDLVQDVLFAIHHKRNTWRRDAPILPWIYAISRYKAIDHLRRENRQPVDLLDEASEIKADTLDPSIAIDLERVIARLDGKMGLVMRAIGLEGQDIKTTAQDLKMSENAVRITFHRGLKKLERERRKNEGGDDHG